MITDADYLEANGWIFMEYCGMWLDPEDDGDHKPPYGLYYEGDAVMMQHTRNGEDQWPI